MTLEIVHEWWGRCAYEYDLFSEDCWTGLRTPLDQWGAQIAACKSREAVQEILGLRWQSIDGILKVLAEEIASYDPKSLVLLDDGSWYLRLLDHRYDDFKIAGSCIYVPSPISDSGLAEMLAEWRVHSVQFKEFMKAFAGIRESMFRAGMFLSIGDADHARGIADTLPPGKWDDAFPFYFALDGSSLLWSDELGVAWWSFMDDELRECWSNLESFVSFYASFRSRKEVFDCASAIP